MITFPDAVFWGTPPRMQGKQKPRFSTTALSKEHPRVCGKNGNTFTHDLNTAGNTPAYAGKTLSEWFSWDAA